MKWSVSVYILYIIFQLYKILLFVSNKAVLSFKDIQFFRVYSVHNIKHISSSTIFPFQNNQNVFLLNIHHTYVIISVSSPGSPKTPSTNRGDEVKLYLFHTLPSSKLNLYRNQQHTAETTIYCRKDCISTHSWQIIQTGLYSAFPTFNLDYQTKVLHSLLGLMRMFTLPVIM